ncbi:hypothetical protein [Actinophytocola xanthii]|uniref:hypothetical protein n=1 Tax=Actinophytocola xanthii TaxID=1912961 RepID=UPI001177DEFD|nr:hypothetical protein [Actinophytocola xanthii]
MVLLLLVSAPVTAAQPFDLGELMSHQVYRAPGAFATLDEERVRAVLRPNDRVLLTPFNGADKDQLREWAGEHDVRLVVVEGLAAYIPGRRAYRAPDRQSLRRLALYSDVTPGVLDLLGQDSSPVIVPQAVDPSPEQVATVVERLREADPKIATFPSPSPGRRHVDYVPTLAREFPDDLVMVVQGRWFDVAAPDQDSAEYARDHLFGRGYIQIFQDGAPSETSASLLVERYEALRAPPRPAFQAPPPAPVSDLWGPVRTAALWTTLIAGAFFALVYLAHTPEHSPARSVHTPTERRLARAEANARIGELGARLLEVETSGAEANPAAAERLATARRLFDQAQTTPGWVEVRKIADEGMALPARQDETS